jgi:hypothetical protein
MQFREDSEGSSKNLIKLKDKESITGVFRGEVVEFRQHWENKQSSLCTGDGCQKCADGKKPSFRFRLNFIVKEGDALVAKIFEQGWTVYGQLREINKDYPLNQNFVKISRSGSGQNDTSYTILPVKNSLLTKEQEAQASAVPLLDLDPAGKSSPSGESQSDEDVPF